MNNLNGSGADISLSLLQQTALPSDAASTLSRSANAQVTGKSVAEDTEAREVANKFEALLLHNMLKSMRKTTMAEDTSNARAIYDDMLDEQLADTMMEAGGIGIADQIVMQINQQRGTNASSAGSISDAQRLRELAAHTSRPTGPSITASSGTSTLQTKALNQSSNGATFINNTSVEGGSTHLGQLRLATQLWSDANNDPLTKPQHDFVKPLVPYAKHSAQKLGTSPAAILAIAALETGWGSSIITDESGVNSHNLFGIKATTSDNSYAKTLTTEYIEGSPQKLQEKFKTFNSDADAVNGFADFILTNPRYSNALQHAGDPERFLNELQDAGYATDPRYADKAISIMRKIARNPLPL